MLSHDESNTLVLIAQTLYLLRVNKSIAVAGKITPVPSMGAGAAISAGKKMRALTATKATINTKTTSSGAMY
ncbi:ATP-dependent helicase [Nostoc cycadae WK-1]|uniref:ATP-dependent helicase n=1 Tax=Nostoc cycadae WK-1 TaxID=1861711 RepID=A0A2H6LNU4_9NOSO|nr:ATP-dependent helicase [Nostoc cycadae WK-1]